jgi:hypothetical protein
MAQHLQQQARSPLWLPVVDGFIYAFMPVRCRLPLFGRSPDNLAKLKPQEALQRTRRRQSVGNDLPKNRFFSEVIFFVFGHFFSKITSYSLDRFFTFPHIVRFSVSGYTPHTQETEVT